MKYHEYVQLESEHSDLIYKPTKLTSEDRKRLSELNQLIEEYRKNNNFPKYVFQTIENINCKCGFNDKVLVYTKKDTITDFELRGLCPECSNLLYEKNLKNTSIEEIYFMNKDGKLN